MTATSQVRQGAAATRIFLGQTRAIDWIGKGLDFARDIFYISEDIGEASKMSDQIGQLEQYVMLAIMRKQPRAYGVSVQQELFERTGKEYSVGAIYTTLEKLEKKGFAASRQGEATAERGGRAKMYFNLTAKGHSALQASLNAIESLRRGLAIRGYAS
jgi:PadR family transcriptional regulator, regulatory protein PadR